MAQILGLPKLSPTMEEGVLVRWTRKEGDKVSPGDLIAEVETDKANMDFNIEDEGVLLKLLVKEGDTVKLGAPVAIIGKAGEDVGALVEQAKSGGGGAKADPAPEAAPAAKPEAKPEAKPAVKADAKPAAKDAKPAAKADAKPDEPRAPAATKPATPAATRAAAQGQPAQQSMTARLLASPLAKSLAIELGIDLRNVQGTGPGGRIVERDVQAAAKGNGRPTDVTVPMPTAEEDAEPEEARVTQALVRQREPAPVAHDPGAGADAFTDVPASNMRKRIAQRLTEAKRDVPHFYLMRELDAAPLLAYRQRLNDLLAAQAKARPGAGGEAPKVSVNDLVIKAVALALRRLPECNASWAGDAIRRHHRVHIGVAVAIEDGLVTPVVRDADLKGIGAIAAEVRDLAERAKSRRLKSHEITGSTFTVSNLGMFGIERFTAILNPPEAGILAVGAVADVPVVANGAVVAGKRMTVTMSCDHRVIDGALGARWLQHLADLVEHPDALAL